MNFDPNSPVVRDLLTEVNRRLGSLRTQLEALDIDPRHADQVRGRIRELRHFHALLTNGEHRAEP